MKVLTHEERLELIHRPFFITNMGASYPHGGVTVTDNFFHPEGAESERMVKAASWAKRPKPLAVERSMAPLGYATRVRVMGHRGEWGKDRSE